MPVFLCVFFSPLFSFCIYQVGEVFCCAFVCLVFAFLHFLHLFVLVFAFYQVGEVADRDGSGCRVVGETSLHSLLVGSIPEEKSF